MVVRFHAGSRALGVAHKIIPPNDQLRKQSHPYDQFRFRCFDDVIRVIYNSRT